MAQTLKTAKIKLESDLKSIFKKASYDAYMEQFIKSNMTTKSDNDAKNGFKDLAEKFSTKLSESLAGDMATAIYDFVKEIGIQCTIPPTVIAPSGPVTGTIPMTNFTII